MASQFTSPPPNVPNVLISFPARYVILITLNRPAQLNAIPSAQHGQLESLYQWFDAEPKLRVAVLAGAGRGFCAGADLKEWNDRSSPPGDKSQSRSGGGGSGNHHGDNDDEPKRSWTASSAGFGGLSNRPGRKPVIAAVHGLCLGGGFEMALNCDMIVAGPAARFGLPEVKRGVVALAGALPRIVRTVGRQRASEMVLTGRMFSVHEMEQWGVVNRVLADGADEGYEDWKEAVVGEAVKLAIEVAENSPDSIIVSREGLRLGWEAMGPELATEVVQKGMYGRMDGGENMKEGLRSFVEKRKPVWVDSKL